MLIRTEIGIDAAGIERLLKRCIDPAQEAERVSQLREQGLLTLGVVATDDEGQVLGYAAFSPVTLNGEDKGWVLLSSLAVDRDQAQQLSESALVREALDTLNEFGYSAVVAYQPYACLPELGFGDAQSLTYRAPQGQGEQQLQVCPLANGPVDGVSGELLFSAPFYG